MTSHDGGALRVLLRSTLCVLLGFSGLSASARATEGVAAPTVVDMSSLTRELTLSKQSNNRMTMTLWLPDDFWRVAIGANGNLSEHGVDDYITVVHPYLLIAVLDADKGITAFHYTNPEALLGETRIEDSRGNIYKPLTPESMGEEMHNMIEVIRPIIGNMLGAFGQHMEYMVFSNSDKAGKPLVDARGKGALTVHVGETILSYRLPIASLLPRNVDPKSGESFPGTYLYNPYTGDKLISPPPISAASKDRTTH
jgi:hypothetical protein